MNKRTRFPFQRSSNRQVAACVGVWKESFLECEELLSVNIRRVTVLWHHLKVDHRFMFCNRNQQQKTNSLNCIKEPFIKQTVLKVLNWISSKCFKYNLYLADTSIKRTRIPKMKRRHAANLCTTGKTLSRSLWYLTDFPTSHYQQPE